MMMNLMQSMISAFVCTHSGFCAHGPLASKLTTRSRPAHPPRSHSFFRSQWQAWFDIGGRLRDAGELLPLDHLDWFKEETVETRVLKLTKMFANEVSSQQEMRVVSQRAKRLLADAPDSLDWKPEMQAKVGVILIKLLI